MIGIVILNYETWDATLKCIKSIEKTENTESVRVYLIDNASSSDMPVALKQYISDHDAVSYTHLDVYKRQVMPYLKVIE